MNVLLAIQAPLSGEHPSVCEDHTEAATHAIPLGNYVSATLGNYVSAKRLNLGNYVSADTEAIWTIVAPSVTR